MEGTIRKVLIVINHILMIGGLALMLYWLCDPLGGFGGEGDRLFNWHPLCMFVAMIVLFSEAIMLNAVWPQGCCSRRVHIALHFLILAIALTGVSIVIAFHFQAGFPNFVSVHSYVGLSTLILLVCQNVVGALLYYCDCCDAWRVAYIPKHRFFGVVIFIVALAAVTLGLFDKQSLIRNSDELSTAKLIPNILAVMVISIGIMSLYIASDTTDRDDRVRTGPIPLQSSDGSEQKALLFLPPHLSTSHPISSSALALSSRRSSSAGRRRRPSAEGAPRLNGGSDSPSPRPSAADGQSAAPLTLTSAPADSKAAPAHAAAAPLSPTSAAAELGSDPLFLRVRDSLSELDAVRRLLETLAQSLRSQPHSARLQRSLSQLRTRSTEVTTDLYAHFMRVPRRDLPLFKPFAERFAELSGAVSRLVVQCVQIAKPPAPQIADTDPPRKRSRGKSADATPLANSVGATAADVKSALPPASTPSLAVGVPSLTSSNGGSGPGPSGSVAVPEPTAAPAGAQAQAQAQLQVQDSDVKADVAVSDEEAAILAQFRPMPFTDESIRAEAARADLSRAMALQSDLRELAGQLREVTDMFDDLRAIVAAQDQPIAAVEQHVASAKTHVQAGAADVVQASKYRRTGLMLTGSLIGLATAGPIGLAVGTKAAVAAGVVGTAIGALFGSLLGNTSKREEAKTTALLSDQKDNDAKAAAADAKAKANAYANANANASATAASASSAAAPSDRKLQDSLLSTASSTATLSPASISSSTSSTGSVARPAADAALLQSLSYPAGSAGGSSGSGGAAGAGAGGFVHVSPNIPLTASFTAVGGIPLAASRGAAGAPVTAASVRSLAMSTPDLHQLSGSVGPAAAIGGSLRRR